MFYIDFMTYKSNYLIVVVMQIFNLKIKNTIIYFIFKLSPVPILSVLFFYCNSKTINFIYIIEFFKNNQITISFIVWYHFENILALFELLIINIVK